MEAGLALEYDDVKDSWTHEFVGCRKRDSLRVGSP